MKSYLKICILLYGISISADNKFFNSGAFSRYIPNHEVARNIQAAQAKPYIRTTNEDHLFYNQQPPVHIAPESPNNENLLFHTPLTKNSKVHIPFTQKIKNIYNETKYTIQNDPSTALIGGTAGGAAGYGIGNLWNNIYKKGLTLVEQKPALVKEYPRIINGLQKVVNSPFLQRAYVVKAIGKFCIIGIGYAANHSKQIEAIKKRVF